MLPRQAFGGAPEGAQSLLQDIQEAVCEGTMGLDEVASYFYVPGLGFHQSGFFLFYHLWSYRMAGRHTVAVSSHMQEALAHTSLAGIRSDDLKMPHRTIYFSFPDSMFQLWGGNSTQWHPCSGAFVSQDHREGSPVLRLYFWGAENGLSQCKGDDASFWFEINLDHIREEGGFDAYITQTLANPANDASFQGLHLEGEALMRQTLGNTHGHIKDIHRLARLVINSVLYLSLGDAVIEQDAEAEANRREYRELARAYGRIKNKNKGKGRRIQKRMKGLHQDHICWIGPPAPMRGTSDEANREGSWWPRRDLVGKRIEGIQNEIENQTPVEEAEAALRGAEGVKSIAEALKKVSERRRWAAAQQTQLEALTESLYATRRWIPPRFKGGGNG